MQLHGLQEVCFSWAFWPTQILRCHWEATECNLSAQRFQFSGHTANQLSSARQVQNTSNRSLTPAATWIRVCSSWRTMVCLPPEPKDANSKFRNQVASIQYITICTFLRNWGPHTPLSPILTHFPWLCPPPDVSVSPQGPKETEHRCRRHHCYPSTSNSNPPYLEYGETSWFSLLPQVEKSFDTCFD